MAQAPELMTVHNSEACAAQNQGFIRFDALARTLRVWAFFYEKPLWFSADRIFVLFD